VTQPTNPHINGIRRRPSRDILSGESADVYFSRAEEILSREGMDPVVVMEVFGRRDAVLCGIDEAKVLIAHVLGDAAERGEATVEALADGDLVQPKEVVMRMVQTPKGVYFEAKGTAQFWMAGKSS